MKKEHKEKQSFSGAEKSEISHHLKKAKELHECASHLHINSPDCKSCINKIAEALSEAEEKGYERGKFIGKYKGCLKETNNLERDIEFARKGYNKAIEEIEKFIDNTFNGTDEAWIDKPTLKKKLKEMKNGKN